MAPPNGFLDGLHAFFQNPVSRSGTIPESPGNQTVPGLEPARHGSGGGKGDGRTDL
ncbi:MAG: hypothetical protein O9301_13005 [Leptospira sp.]|nr:hypothetical protein [Leptospira sp.]